MQLKLQQHRLNQQAFLQPWHVQYLQDLNYSGSCQRKHQLLWGDWVFALLQSKATALIRLHLALLKVLTVQLHHEFFQESDRLHLKFGQRLMCKQVEGIVRWHLQIRRLCQLHHVLVYQKQQMRFHLFLRKQLHPRVVLEDQGPRLHCHLHQLQ